MSKKFVRDSKFRHVFGTAAKKELCYENITITRSSLEAKFSAANPKFIAVCVFAGGGGSFLVIPHDKVGRQDINAAKVAGHASDVLDLEWNPFNDHMIASSDDDGNIKIWEIPDEGLTSTLTAPLLTISHRKKCTQVSWHPSAANILMSVSAEPSVAVWNLESAEKVCSVTHPDTVYNAEWNESGSLIVSACKDKMFRIFNPRSGDILSSIKGHPGGKPQRVIFLDDDRLFSTGFTKMSSREYAVWDVKTGESLNEDQVDTANGTLIPYYDRDTKLLYLAGRGDSTIRYYEMDDEDPYIHWISNYSAKLPHRAVCLISKRGCDTRSCEVARFYRLLSDKHLVEPVTFTVPRKSDEFQKDLYPPTPGDEPALTAEEWQSGKDAAPIKIQLKFTSAAQTKKAVGGLGLKSAAKPAGTASSDAAKPTATTAAVAAGGAVSSSEVSALKNEIKVLKENETKLKDELSSVKNELSKLKNDFSAMMEAVKKNDSRVTVLESLVQEVSDDEGK